MVDSKRLLTFLIIIFLSACVSSKPRDRASSNVNPSDLSIVIDQFIQGCVNTADNPSIAPDVFKQLGYTILKSEKSSLRLQNNLAEVRFFRSSYNGNQSDEWGQCDVFPKSSNANLLLALARPKIEAVLGAESKIPRQEAWKISSSKSVVIWSRNNGGFLARTQSGVF